jgi:uncharacterized protein YdaU (DUF1376 family)
MNFYDFHIGDYASRTAHLEPMEDLAYRRMLDLYYVREEALPLDAAEVARLIRLKDQVETVEAVLREFFIKTDAGYAHTRCETVISAAADKRTKAQASAAQRWESERNAKAMRPHSDGIAPSPTTQSQSQKKPPKSPKGDVAGFEEFYAAYPKKEGRATAAKAFDKVDAPIGILMAALSWQRRGKQWTKDGGAYIPLPASWLNQRRWEDQQDLEAAEEGEWHQSRSGVEGKAREMGLRPWIEIEEQWPTFKRRVMQSVKDLAAPAISFEQLQALSSARQGVAQ